MTGETRGGLVVGNVRFDLEILGDERNGTVIGNHTSGNLPDNSPRLRFTEVVAVGGAMISVAAKIIVAHNPRPQK